MALELGPSHLSVIPGKRAIPPEPALGTFPEQFSWPPPTSALGLTFPRDLDRTPEVTQDKLGSVCLCQTFLFCVHWYLASPCPSYGNSYPCGQFLSSQRVFMALLAWAGAYQNIVIYICEFVVQCNGNKHLCRKALSCGWQRCLNHCQLTVFKQNPTQKLGITVCTLCSVCMRKLSLS